MTPENEPELVDSPEAARLLGVDESRIRVMIDDGMLQSLPGKSGPLLRRAEVLTLREAGA